MTLIAPTLQAFFTDRLTQHLDASPRTLASYRDSLRLLLCFANDRDRDRAVGAGLGRPRRAADQPRSSRTSRPTVTTAHEPGTCGSPRSAHCFATPRCATPNMPR